MKERTEIDQQSLHFTYMELVSCRTYDDARDLLNELVTTELVENTATNTILTKKRTSIFVMKSNIRTA